MMGLEEGAFCTFYPEQGHAFMLSEELSFSFGTVRPDNPGSILFAGQMQDSMSRIHADVASNTCGTAGLSTGLYSDNRSHKSRSFY